MSKHADRGGQVVELGRATGPKIGKTVWRLRDFLQEPDDTPPLLLSPWLRGGEQWMVHGAAGTGKTYFGLAVAWAVASGGSFLGWKAEASRPVLYVDAEVAKWEMRGRLRRMVETARLEGNGDPEKGQDNFVGYQATYQPEGFVFPDMGTEAGVEALLERADGAVLVVIDNLATCIRTGDPNEVAWWAPMQAALQALRKRGTAALVVHHQNKAGEQRGTNAKEDMLDGVLRLSRPEDYHAMHGARFILDWDKGRALQGCDKVPILAQLQDSPFDGRLTWNYQVRDPNKHHELMRLAKSGEFGRAAEIAEAIGVSEARVSQLKREVINDLHLFTARDWNGWLAAGRENREREAGAGDAF